MKITQTLETYNNGKLKATEVKEITEREYDLLTNTETIKYFRKLGGAETTKKRYTNQGYRITYLSSISPDKKIKIVRNFKFN